MQASFLLAHLSDVHLGPLPMPPMAQLDLKRVLGILNWHKGRRAVHRPEVAERLLADIAAQGCDHIAVTGDLANIGLAAEHRAAAAWLACAAPPERLTVVPGNHDIYTWPGGLGDIEAWRPHMTGETLGPASEAGRPDGFPFVRRCGRVALIGVNSAVPTRPFHAGGLVGDGQLARLGRMLAALGREGLMRVVLIHHPPLPGLAAPAKALADAGALAEILGEHGAELVLHGHNHRFMLNTQQGPAGGIPVVGVPSASARSAHGREELARYHLLGFRDGEPIEFVARGLADTDGPVVELGRWRLGGEAAPHPHVRG